MHFDGMKWAKIKRVCTNLNLHQTVVWDNLIYT